MKQIPLTDLVDMSALAATEPFTVDVVYAQPDHPENLFQEAVYRPEAKLYLHKDLAKIVIKAAKLCKERFNQTFELKDGLRPSTAQDLMQYTKACQENPHWMNGTPRLLSPPGRGGHPRGMAIDIILRDEDGAIVPMGTAFDALPPQNAPNPNHRDHKDFGLGTTGNLQILANRQRLEDLMLEAAKSFNLPLVPLPQEWWDFRFPPEIYDEWAPISDDDLPEDIKICLTELASANS